MFKVEPEKYSPQYGGYCAYAVLQGETANIDPKSWKIVDGRNVFDPDEVRGLGFEYSSVGRK